MAATLGNIHRAKDAKPFTPEDFTPQIAKPPEPAVVAKKRQADALSRRLRAWFGAGKR